MICLLSYVGMNLQSEVCLWTLLGILRTILEATSLFKVNDKLKQVWQMSMPAELSMPVQRALRTMICGVLLMQCFTVYVYLASYVVLLYPVVLEERPTLVLLWLLLAAIRNFLCELTSLAIGLGVCMLLGPAKPPCVKFVISKIASITPALYMWMLVYTYYKSLKLAIAFKRFPAVMQASDHDYGLELAVRRRRTKSLQKEEHLRRNLNAIFQNDSTQHLLAIGSVPAPRKSEKTQSNLSDTILSTPLEASNEGEELDIVAPLSDNSERLLSNLGVYEDWCGDEVTLPRDTDRILEQFVLMMLRIGAYIKSGESDPTKLFSSLSPVRVLYGNLDCPTVSNDVTDTPPSVGSNKPRTTSYIEEYPQIFMKKASDSFQRIPEQMIGNKYSVNKQEQESKVNSTQDDKGIGTSSLDNKKITEIFEGSIADSSHIIMKDANQSTSENNIAYTLSRQSENNSDSCPGVTIKSASVDFEETSKMAVITKRIDTDEKESTEGECSKYLKEQTNFDQKENTNNESSKDIKDTNKLPSTKKDTDIDKKENTDNGS